jgi:hypothetical protein
MLLSISYMKGVRLVDANEKPNIDNSTRSCWTPPLYGDRFTHSRRD